MSLEQVRELVAMALNEARGEEARRASAVDACAAILGSTLAGQLGPKFAGLLALASGRGTTANERENAAMSACSILHRSGAMARERMPAHTDAELQAIVDRMMAEDDARSGEILIRVMAEEDRRNGGLLSHLEPARVVIAEVSTISPDDRPAEGKPVPPARRRLRRKKRHK